MKIYKKHLQYLKVLNLLSVSVILLTIFYAWFKLRTLPEIVHLPGELSSMDFLVMNKSAIWGDIKLMVASYMLISLISIFIELIPFRYSSGFHKAQFVSLVNLCISVVFAYTIISTVSAAAP